MNIFAILVDPSIAETVDRFQLRDLCSSIVYLRCTSRHRWTRLLGTALRNYTIELVQIRIKVEHYPSQALVTQGRRS